MNELIKNYLLEVGYDYSAPVLACAIRARIDPSEVAIPVVVEDYFEDEKEFEMCLAEVSLIKSYLETTDPSFWE